MFYGLVRAGVNRPVFLPSGLRNVGFRKDEAERSVIRISLMVG